MYLKLFCTFALFWTTVSGFSQGQEKDTCILRIEKITAPEKRARAYNFASEAAWQSGDLKKALTYTHKGIVLCKKHHFKKIESYLLNNRGIAYELQVDYPSALKNYFAALEILKSHKDPEMKGKVLNNIGLVYMYQGRNDDAMGYFQKSMEIRKGLNDLQGVSSCMNNMAIVHAQAANYREAIDLYLECIRIDQQLEDEAGLGDEYNNISLCYLDVNAFDTASYYLEKSLEIRQRLGDERAIAETMGNIGTVHYKKGEYAEARRYFLMAIPLAQRTQDKESLRYMYEMLSVNAVAMNDSASAFGYYQYYIAYRDSIDNSEIARKQTELELNYAFKQEREMDRMKQEEKDHRQMIILYSALTGLALILSFSVLLFRKWKQTQRQQQIIAEKNKLVQQKNDEILDSINYAKRIQRAILPADSELRNNFPEHFVCYLPKDIVSGDFYWHDRKGDLFFLAVADCTGHGVPGALMSVVCHNALNRALHEFNFTAPAEILNKCHALVVEELSKSWDNVRDGMDISLLSYSHSAQRIEWAGANNPLWILRANGKNIEELKADKFAIGHEDKEISFTSHSIQVSSGDRFYLFSDGFADQFGGEQGKKFMRKNLKLTLLECRAIPMQQQGTHLMEVFQQWKGELEQVDDVCLVGFEVLT